MPDVSYANRGRIYPATHASIALAAKVIKSGGLVAFPTETVYGLGANALDEAAVSRIFEAKGRPQDNPLILHISNIREAACYGKLNPSAEILMQHFWPGPLTIVLYSLDNVPLVTRANMDTVALRVPMNFVALDLIREAGLPIAAPSANRSGRPSPTTAETVWNDLGTAVDMIIDGGDTSIGVESTVIDATEGTVSILRPGGVTREMLEQIVDVEPDAPRHANRSPGTRHRHYAPTVAVKLWQTQGRELFTDSPAAWCYLGLRRPPEGAMKQIIFDSPEGYAHGLFGAMRELERCGADVIIADFPDDSGIGEAIRNRLKMAAGGA
ncbi:MAG: threonylcarbamoyl-AMP synthase [Synergistaceae bacterium]|nr:threonylcarbamoyl-AMP synthase [Synergistaceae bacterium]